MNRLCACCKDVKYTAEPYGTRDLCAACAIKEAIKPTPDLEAILGSIFGHKGTH